MPTWGWEPCAHVGPGTCGHRKDSLRIQRSITSRDRYSQAIWGHRRHPVTILSPPTASPGTCPGPRGAVALTVSELAGLSMVPAVLSRLRSWSLRHCSAPWFLRAKRKWRDRRALVTAWGTGGHQRGAVGWIGAGCGPAGWGEPHPTLVCGPNSSISFLRGWSYSSTICPRRAKLGSLQGRRHGARGQSSGPAPVGTVCGDSPGGDTRPTWCRGSSRGHSGTCR